MNYLDTNKSIVISSPAGSGKTEKLARRYIALLQAGVEIERILAITFTEKASAEMKQRILRILREEDKRLFENLLEKMPLMRVSTIHSFCGTLLRRFSFEAGVDPDYQVEDAIDSQMAWEEIFHDILMDAGTGGEGYDLFLETIVEKGFRGLASLRDTIRELFGKSPFSLEADVFQYAPLVTDSLTEELISWRGAGAAIEGYEEFFENLHPLTPLNPPLEKGGNGGLLTSIERYFLTEKKEPRKKTPAGLKGIADYQEWARKMHLLWKDMKIAESAERTDRILRIFRRCMAMYADRKRTRGVLDFSDLEYLTFRILTGHPEWANILYAFDEKTDHILVDEFQDTNTFQWGIINKLTEEWRSGMGAKREEGIKPTIFLVGDEKQSIYFFRGANVELFRRAKDQMHTWLGEEFSYEEAKENFRSRPAIVEFTNLVFSRIMQVDDHVPPWMTRYSPFSAAREGISETGRVELILLNDEDKIPIDVRKQKEAEALSRRILGLAGEYWITDRGSRQQRACRFADMAVLLRKRTHLRKYEEAFRRHGIPFVAVKGIGFYQEPEVAMLRSMIFFLSNTKDDYSLYVLLKSPLFQIEESVILKLTNTEGDSLFEKMRNVLSENPPSPPFAKGGDTPLDPLLIEGENPHHVLHDWLSQAAHMPISELIETALVQTKAWRYFHEPQRRANIKKFIRIVEDLETNGKSLIKIRDFLERTVDESDESKSNVNTEGMDAVKIMTIHAAKGLEFPLVFVPGLEEPFTRKTGENLIYEYDGNFFFKSETEASIRRQDDDFLLNMAKEEEEQKRLFYVAVTRAEEALFLIGHRAQGDGHYLSYLRQGLGIEKTGSKYTVETDIEGLSFLSENDITALFDKARKVKTQAMDRRHIEATPTPLIKQLPWKAVTETADIRRRHGRDRQVLGDILHRIFEGVSNETINDTDVESVADRLLKQKWVRTDQKAEMIRIINDEISVLKEKGIWQSIIMPRKDAFSELPFILEEGDVVYSGRIDRIIKEDNLYKIYDYKTFPVKEKEIEYLLREYGFQMSVYKKAVKKLFSTNAVTSFIVFTHTGEIKEVGL